MNPRRPSGPVKERTTTMRVNLWDEAPPRLDTGRLATGGAVSFPRPRRTPLGHLAWWGGWLLVWTAWWFAAGVLVGWEWRP